MSYRPYPKRDPIKNCFLVPNEIYDLGLLHGAIAVYGYLLRCEDRRTYRCHPSYKTIGKALNMSENTVRKYVTELEEKRLIRTEPTTIATRDGRRRNGSLMYNIRPIQEAIDYYHERQMRELEETVERQRAQSRLSLPCGPQEPLCAVLTEAESPSPTRRNEAEFEPNLDVLRGTEEKAGESTGAFAAPVQPLPPAVRTVSGNGG